MAESLIQSRYEITAYAINLYFAIVNVTTANSNTFFNTTGLLPGTTYEWTVVAISEGGDVISRSQGSNSVEGIAAVTGVCVWGKGCLYCEYSSCG